jgi:hypothetical protein
METVRSVATDPRSSIRIEPGVERRVPGEANTRAADGDEKLRHKGKRPRLDV